MNLNKIGFGVNKGESEFIELNKRDYFYILGSRFHLGRKSALKLLKIFSYFGLAEFGRRRVYLNYMLYLLLIGEYDGRK